MKTCKSFFVLLCVLAIDNNLYSMDYRSSQSSTKEATTKFFRDVEQGNIDSICKFFASKNSISPVSIRQKCSLISYVKNQPETDLSVKVLKKLIQAGADKNLFDKTGTPLYYAIEQNKTRFVKVLLRAGANTECLVGAEFSATPLYYAANWGLYDIVGLLLSAGAKRNFATSEDKFQPLHIAAQEGHEAIVRLLLAFYADPNALTQGGDTPLHLAVENNHESVVRVFLEMSITKNCKTINFGMRDKDNLTPADLALKKGHERIFCLFLAYHHVKPTTNLVNIAKYYKIHEPIWPELSQSPIIDGEAADTIDRPVDGMQGDCVLQERTMQEPELTQSAIMDGEAAYITNGPEDCMQGNYLVQEQTMQEDSQTEDEESDDQMTGLR